MAQQWLPIAGGLSCAQIPWSVFHMCKSQLGNPEPASFPIISLQVLNEDGYSSTIKDKILTIDVKPGWRQGTRITFEKEGDQVRVGKAV